MYKILKQKYYLNILKLINKNSDIKELINTYELFIEKYKLEKYILIYENKIEKYKLIYEREIKIINEDIELCKMNIKKYENSIERYKYFEMIEQHRDKKDKIESEKNNEIKKYESEIKIIQIKKDEIIDKLLKSNITFVVIVVPTRKNTKQEMKMFVNAFLL